MKNSDRHLVAWSFRAALLVLLSSYTLIGVCSFRLLDAFRWVDHTQQVLITLKYTNALIRQAETAGHGYVVTGQSGFMRPFAVAVETVPDQMHALRVLTADNIHQQSRLNLLQPLVRQKLEHLQRRIALRQHGRSSTAWPEGNDSVMESIHEAFDGLRAEEERLLVVRTEAESNANKRTVETFVLGAILSLLLLVWVYRRLQSAEDKVFHNERQFRLLIENSSDILTIVNPDGSIRYESPSVERILGYRVGELSGQPIFAFVHPDDKASALKAFKEGTVRDGVARPVEVRFRHKDGSWRVLEVIGNALLNDPEVAGVVMTSRDITERKQIEADNRRVQLFLHSIVENLPLMVFVKYAKDLRFVLFNKAGEDLVGFKRDELIGKSDFDFFPKEQADFFVAKDRQVLEGGKLIDIPEESLRTKSGENRIVHTKKIPIFENGKPAFLLGISDDVTERKHNEQELQQARKLHATR